MSLPTYSTGTVSVSNGGTTVTGVGTLWTGVNARADDSISVDGLEPVKIKDVTDATHIELWAPWAPATKSGKTYTIIQNYPSRVVGVAAAEDVGTMLAKLKTDGLPFLIGPDETEPDPSLGSDGQYTYQPTTETWWLKAAGVWVISVSPRARVALTANKTLYVAPTGNDANTGVISAPWLTLQHTHDVIINTYDIAAGVTLTVQVADGTYAQGVNGYALHVGAGDLVFQGNYAHPENIVVNSTTGEGTFTWLNGSRYIVRNLEVRSSIQHALYAKWGGRGHYNNLRFGTVVNGHKTVSYDGVLVCDGEGPGETRKYAIVGNFARHEYFHNGAIRTEACAITVVGTPTCSAAFAYGTGSGHLNLYGTTISGGASVGGAGVRFDVSDGASIQGDQSLTFLPGQNGPDGLPGVTRSGGAYFGAQVQLANVVLAGIGSNTTDGIAYINSAAATSGQQQWSPRLRLTGQGWKTNATAASQQTDWCIENQVSSGIVSPTGRIVWSYQVNGGGYNAVASLHPSGFFNVIAGGGYTIGGAAPANHLMLGDGTAYRDASSLPLSALGGLATNVAAWLAAPSSANLIAAMTDESGSGALLFAGGNIGAATATTAAPGTNTTQVANTAYVQTAITALIGGAPGALDTLKELADAINDDASYAATITSALGLKAPLANPVFTGTLTAALMAGGSAASSSLTLQSTSGSGTTDAILFKTGSGTERARITTGGLVNIGGAFAPDSLLTVNGNVAAPDAPTFGTPQLHLVGAAGGLTGVFADAYAGQGIYAGRRSDGTISVKSAVAANSPIFSFFGQAWDGSAYATSGAMDFLTLNLQSGTDHSGLVRVRTVAGGSTTLANAAFFHGSKGFSVMDSTDPGAGAIGINTSAWLIRNKTTWSNGAAAAAGTLSNAPAAGNPTKWIPVDDNGTTRYIPAW